MSFLDNILKKQVIGLDIGVSGIKAIELSSEKTPRLVAYNRIPLDWETISADGEVKDRQALVIALKSLFEMGSFTSKKVAVSALGRSIISKRITVPLMSAEELDHQLYFEAEQYIPFNTDEVNLDFVILGPNTQRLESQPQMDVLLVAAKKDAIESLKGLIKESGLNPVLIDTQAFSLSNIFEHNYGVWAKKQGCSCCALIDFGAGSTKITIIEGGQTSFSRDIQNCGTKCSEELSEKLGVTFLEAENLKIQNPDDPAVGPLLLEYAQSTADEITRTFDYFMSQSIESSIDSIFVCGGGSLLKGLIETLKVTMPAPVEKLNPLKHVVGAGQKISEQILDEMICLGSVAAGLSLRKQGDT